MSGFRRFFWLLWLLALAALALAACAPSPTPSLPPSPTPSPTPSLPPSPTPTPTPTPAPPPALTADRLAAALPGLQALGAPAVRCPGGDDPALAALCLAVAHGAAPSLTFPQLTVEALPPDAAGGAAHGPALRRGAQLTLLGRVQGGEQDGHLAFAVSDEARGEPWLFFGWMAPGEAEALLGANGYGLAQDGEVWRVVGGPWGEAGAALAAIPAEDPLLGRLQAAMGVWFFDKRVGQNGQLEFHPRPIVPHPPKELVPPDTPITYRPDEKAGILTALGPDGQPLAQARFDEEKGGWVWQEVLVLEPATLTIEEAKRIIIGFEHLSEAELQEKLKELKGRVFLDKRTAGKIVFSDQALQHIFPDGLSNLSAEEIAFRLASKLGETDWYYIYQNMSAGEPGKWLKYKFINYEKGVLDRNNLPVKSYQNPLPWLFLREGDKSLVFSYVDDEEVLGKTYVGFVGWFDSQGQATYQRVPLLCQAEESACAWKILTHYIRLWGKTGQLVIDDSYQIKAVLAARQGQYDWRPVPPGEHHYVITDPEKQVEFVVNKLRTEKSSHSAIYEFDRYLVTNPYDGLPQIIIPITDGVPGLTDSQKHMILAYLFEKGRTKKLNEEKEKQIYDMLKPLKNGFTPEQAKAIQNWFNAWFDKLSSNRGDKATEEVIKIINAADVRFVVSNGLDMMKRFTNEGHPYASIPNDFDKSIFGIEIDPYLDESTRGFLIHEISQIYLLQIVGPNFTSEQRDKIEKILSASAPPLEFP